MNGRERLNWPETAMKLAKTIASCRSEDPYIQVGACAIKNDGTIVLGYNGAPPKVDIDWADRGARRPYVIHAESNVLDLCRPYEVNILAVTHLPCPECVKRMAKYGLRTVYYSSKNYQSLNEKLTFDMAEKFNIILSWLP